MSDWIERPRRGVRGLGRRRRHVPARLRAHRRRRDHPGRRPRRPPRARLRGRGRAASAALADERFREILPMLVFEMQHSIDHYNACAKRDARAARRAHSTTGCARPRPTLASASRALLERHLVGSAARDGRRRCQLTAVRASSELREPQRLSHQLSTLLAAEIVSGRIGVGEAFPVLGGDRQPVRRQPDRGS